MNTEIAIETPTAVASSDWRPLASAARGVFMSVAAISAFLLTLVIVAVFLMVEDDAPWWYFFAAFGLAVMNASIAAYIAFNRWRNTFWKLDEEALHVRRGKTWFKQICLPRSRVQHLDFERGPLERHFGLATLIVHTAGSHERAVRQSGLGLADAEYLRDVLVPKDRRNDE